MPETQESTPASSAPAIEAAAPAAPAAESTAAAPETPAQTAAETKASVNAVYDQAYQETMVVEDLEDDAQPSSPQTAPNSAAENPATEPKAATAPQPSKAVTASEEQVLKRAGFDSEDYAGWTREKIEAKVAKLRQSQTEQDRVGSELAQLKQGKQPEPEKKPAEAKEAPKDSRLKAIREQLTKAYDADIEPLLDVIDQIDTENRAFREQAQSSTEAVPVLLNVLSEMMVEMSLASIQTDYPSLSKPEARSKVVERFWTEWNTGAYSKPGMSMRDQVSEAMRNAAKVTFNNTTEQSAAASLVQANKARIASQPRNGSPNARPGPRTVDDVYNEGFENTIGKELAGR